MKKIALILTLLVIAVGGATALGVISLGYFPGISKGLGIGGPRDLGVTYTEADYLSARSKMTADGTTPVVMESFTDAEITALLNGCGGRACVLENVQIKTGADGVFEFTGVIKKENIENFLSSVNVEGQQSEDLQRLLTYMPPEPAFYAQAEVQGENDVVVFSLQTAELANIPVPDSLISEIDSQVMAAINDYLASLEGTQLRTITVTEGEIFIDATLIAEEQK